PAGRLMPAASLDRLTPGRLTPCRLTPGGLTPGRRTPAVSRRVERGSQFGHARRLPLSLPERTVRRAIGRGVRLETPPPVRERTGVHRVVADRVQERAHRRLGLRVVAGDR